MMESLDAGASRLVRLIDDLLDVARLQTGQLQVRAQDVDLSELLAAATESYRSQLSPGQELVVEDVVPNRVYDHELSQGLGSKVLEVDADGYFAKPVMEQIPVKLYRVEVGERAALAAG